VITAMNHRRAWTVFALVFGWKIALLVISVQPVPANDAFFFDGAVVNRLVNGGYYNPSITMAFPTSGGRLFSAYPPLYQAPLLGWMSVFGASALSAMSLHFPAASDPGWMRRVWGRVSVADDFS
jgi:hypothetical protein